jgi:hypothetical protein
MEKKLWIVVKEGNIEACKSLEDAVSKFNDLAIYVTTESQIVCLTYNPMGKINPAIVDVAMFRTEQVKIEEIAKIMLQKTK